MKTLRRFDPDWTLPALLVVGLTSFFAVLAMRSPPFDGDLIWQRWLGERILHDHVIPRALGPESFAANGAPWTPHEWLLSIAVAFFTNIGTSWMLGLLAGIAAGWCLTTVLFRSRRRGVSAIGCTIAVALCAASMGESFGIRAQVFGWAGLATLLWLLELESAAAWCAILATALWANVHASAVIAPLIAATFAAVAAIEDRRWTPRVARSIAIAFGCGLAVLATPLGVDLPRYAYSLEISPIRSWIIEWQPTSLANLSFATGALPLVLALAIFGAPRTLRDRIVTAAFLIALFQATRNIPVFALAIAPVALASIPWRRWAAASRSPSPAAWSAAALLALTMLVMTGAAWRQAPKGVSPLPYGAATLLSRDPAARARIFCEDFAWCSLFLDDATAGVFMDGRADPYPVSLWRDYRDVVDAKPRWAEVLSSYRITAVITRKGGALDSLLSGARPTWRVAGSDRNVRVYARRHN